MPVGRIANRVACSKCGCNHRLFAEEDGAKYRAACQCDEPTCGDFELKKEDVALWALDARKLPELMGKLLPMEPRLFPTANAPFKAWRLGVIHLRPDGRAGSLVACFSAKDLDLNNAALGVGHCDLGPTVFVCRTDRAEQLEAILPPGSRVIGFESMWTVASDGFHPGKSARRLMTGWDDEMPAAPAQGVTRNGYFFEPRGRKKTRLSNDSFEMTTWRCSMEGRSFDLPDVIGSELLVRILLRRGDQIYADTLLRSLSGEAPDVVDEDSLEWLGNEDFVAGTKRHTPDAPEEILTTEQITTWQRRAQRIQREIEECGDDPSLAGDKANLTQKQDEILEYLKASTKPGPDGTLLPKTFDGALKSAGNLVGKHIRGVIEQLQAVDQKLWSHLSNKSILKHGQVCHYDAELGYRWQQK